MYFKIKKSYQIYFQIQDSITEGGKRANSVLFIENVNKIHNLSVNCTGCIKKNASQRFQPKIGSRGRISLFQGCFRIRISSPKHLDTLIIPIKNIKCPKNAKNAEKGNIFQMTVDPNFQYFLPDQNCFSVTSSQYNPHGHPEHSEPYQELRGHTS